MWKKVIDKSYYITQFEAGEYKCDTENSLISDYYMAPNINKAIEEKLGINASYGIFDNITEEILKSSAEMFIYLNHCYDDHHGGEVNWLHFYKNLFLYHHPKDILLVVNRLRNTKQGAIADKILNLLQKTWNLTFDGDILIDNKDFAVLR